MKRPRVQNDVYHVFIWQGFIALKADTILVRSCIATIEVAITLLDPAKVTNIQYKNITPTRTGLHAFFDFSLTVKAAPHECVIRTGQP